MRDGAAHALTPNRFSPDARPLTVSPGGGLTVPYNPTLLNSAGPASQAMNPTNSSAATITIHR